jgi:hypothetical protein
LNQKEEVLADLKILQDELKVKAGPVNMGAPQFVLIAHDDYHAQNVGRTEDGLQFFVTSLFVPALFDNPGNEFIAVFLFNDDGDLVESKIDELGPRSKLDLDKARALKRTRIDELGEKEFGDIVIKPFAVEHYGEMMGFLPSKYEGRWAVELHPGNFMSFSEPWDSGEYDT